MPDSSDNTGNPRVWNSLIIGCLDLSCGLLSSTRHPAARTRTPFLQPCRVSNPAAYKASHGLHGKVAAVLRRACITAEQLQPCAGFFSRDKPLDLRCVHACLVHLDPVLLLL